MKTRVVLLGVLGLLSIASERVLSDQFFRSVDDAGGVVYSDRSLPGSVPVRVDSTRSGNEAIRRAQELSPSKGLAVSGGVGGSVNSGGGALSVDGAEDGSATFDSYEDAPSDVLGGADSERTGAGSAMGIGKGSNGGSGGGGSSASEGIGDRGTRGLVASSGNRTSGAGVKSSGSESSRTNVDNTTTTSMPIIGAQSFATDSWLRGGWGVRFVLPGGRGFYARSFDSKPIVDQLSELQTARWAMVNLTHPAWGGLFTAPNAFLEEIDVDMVPDRDLLGDTISHLADNSFRILVYFATSGPDISWRPAEKIAEFSMLHPALATIVKKIEINWDDFLASENISHMDAVSQLILDSYSRLYGSAIHGWWFDHAETGNFLDYSHAIRTGNPDALIAWNEAHEWIPRVGVVGSRQFLWGVKRSHENEDFTAGHITPPEWLPPWASENDVVVDKLLHKSLSSDDRSPVFHLFVPVQSTWRGGDEVFPLDKMIDWTRSIIAAGGAITWAIALEAPEFSKSRLNEAAFERVKELDAVMSEAGLPTLR